MENNTIIIIISFIAAITKFILSYCILKKNPSAKVNRFFAVVFYSQAIWDFCKGLMWLMPGLGYARFFAKVSYTGYMISVMMFPHFCWILLKRKNFFRKSKFTVFLWYTPLIFLTIALWTSNTVIHHLVVPNQSVYGYGIHLWDYAYGPVYNYFFFWFQMLPFLYGLIVFIHRYFKTDLIDLKNQLKYMIIGMSFPIIIGIPTGVVFPAIGMTLPPHNNVLSVLMSLFIAIGIIKYKFLTIMPNPEDTTKLPKVPPEVDEYYHTELSNSYLISHEKSSTIAYYILLSHLSKKKHGVIITCQDPDKIRKQFSFKNTPIIWVSEKESEQFSVGPNDLEQIYTTIEKFTKKVTDSYIVLDCLDSLIENNNFIKIHHLIKRISKRVEKFNCCLVVAEGKAKIDRKKEKRLKKELLILPTTRKYKSLDAELEAQLKKLSKEDKNFVILGHNSMSDSIITEFELRKIKCTLIDNRSLNLYYKNIKYIKGDPLSRRILNSLKIDDFKTVVLITLDKDSDVILATNIVRQISYKAQIIANVNNLEFVKIAKDAGANHVVPSSTIGGKLLSLAVRSPNTVQWIMDSTTFGKKDTQLIELDAAPGSSLIGKTIYDVDKKLQQKAHIIAINTTKGFDELPDDKYKVEEGDKLIFLTNIAKEHFHKHVHHHMKH